ncbi:MAG: hypothetical protein JW840_10370 [Candidatus Thermoplasmatota archaeon]|nr:hypothetical protein [Candidatus Thermoplasmatota archaeon]
MDNQAKLGMIAGILLIFFLLVGLVSASIIYTTSGDITEEDLNRITNEVVDEICSYLQIKHIIGQYQMIQNEHTIKKIGILIKPYVSQNIDISHISIEVCNGEQYHMLFYSELVGSIRSSTLFEHPLWDLMNSSGFSVLSTIDDDNSIGSSHMINKNTDMAFILITLPDNLAMKYGDQIEITILPSPGMSRTVWFEAPLPIKNVVTLYP